MPSTQYLVPRIPYTIKRTRRRRSVALRVEPSGAVTVFAPRYALNYFIRQFVQDRAAWIVERQRYFAELARAQPAPMFPEVSYREAEEKIRACVERFAPQLKVSVRRVSVGDPKSRWGSCSHAGSLRFNWRLARMPLLVLEYVVVHELAHRVHMNHSKNFWSTVESVLPDYSARRKWLRVNGPRFHVN